MSAGQDPADLALWGRLTVAPASEGLVRLQKVAAAHRHPILEGCHAPAFDLSSVQVAESARRPGTWMNHSAFFQAIATVDRSNIRRRLRHPIAISEPKISLDQKFQRMVNVYILAYI
jgi:hypothetical protein